MASYTIAEEKISDIELRVYYNKAKCNLDYTSWGELDLIFDVALSQKERFPGINLKGANNPADYIQKWAKGYVDAMNNLPSTRKASPKSACSDPAVKIIVQATQDLTNEAAMIGESDHNLFMSAENIQGNLLEEYIASKVRPYGFLWCAGNTLEATDFCNTDGTLLLQVKNKNNTENSSSSKVREGTSIKKWYRLGTVSRNGHKLPDYKWDILNNLINMHKTTKKKLPLCSMSEDDYQKFLLKISRANPDLITDK